MNYIDNLKAWNKLKEMVNLIHDTKAKKLYHDTFLLKAIEEWGFNPEKPTKIEFPTVIKLEQWEQDVLKGIKAAQEYGINIRTDEEKKELHSKFKINMLEFIKSGGQIEDLPQSLQNSKFIINSYFEIKRKLYFE